MIDHIYGRGESLVSAERPHMFCQELEIYINYYEKLLSSMGSTTAEINYLEVFRQNLEKGIELILEYSEKKPYPNENLESIPGFVKVQSERLKLLFPHKTELQTAVNF
jgi:hypothetical protein